MAENSIDEDLYEVEFMNLIVDKADNLKVVDCDSHFSEFTGVHPSKIKQGKLFLYDIIKPVYREEIMTTLCKKDSPYVYFDAEFTDKNSDSVYIHCTGHNYDNSTLCRLTLADVSKSMEYQEALRQQANEMNYLIDLVAGGVCLFMVTAQMHIDVLYLNEGGCRLFGTSKAVYKKQNYRIDELIHPEDKTVVFQAIGKAMATNEPVDAQIRVMKHKDEFIWCKFSAGIQKYDEDNNPVFHAMFTDITRVKEAEARADAINDMLVGMFKNLPDAIFCTDTEEPLKLRIVSEEFIKFLGYSRSELFEKHEGMLSDFMTQREARFVNANIKKQLQQSDEIKINYSVRTKSGVFVEVYDKRRAVAQDDGKKSMVCSLKKA
ncbi:MAG: PAS domain-containing protein [Eubacterium sp.]